MLGSSKEGDSAEVLVNVAEEPPGTADGIVDASRDAVGKA